MVKLETLHPGGLAQPAHCAVQHQPEHGQCADGPQHQCGHAAVAGRARQGVGRVGTQLRQLQPVVAHKQRQGLHIAHRRTHLDVQAQPTLRTQQGGHRRHQRHPAAAAKAGFVGFTVLQQFRVQPQAGVDQKQPVVQGRHLHGAGVRIQQQPHRRSRIGGNAVCAGKVVEGAAGHDPHRATGGVCGLGHGVEAAIAAHRHHRRAACHRQRGGLVGHPLQLRRLANQQLTWATVRRQHRFNHPAFGLHVVGPRGGVDHKQQARRRIKPWSVGSKRRQCAHFAAGMGVSERGHGAVCSGFI